MYLLNAVNISTYGITPGHSPRSNISLQGCFDMPARTGECYHDWGDEDSVEAWVLADEIMFAGRDITFYGSMFGTRSVINALLQSLYDAIAVFTDTVTFSTPYGDFTVYIKSIVPQHYHGASSVIITFREPVVSLAGDLPAEESSNYEIDSIPFASFGVYVSKPESIFSLPELKEQQFTLYGAEGYQIVKRKAKTLEIDGFISSTSLADFIEKIQALYKVFSSAGLRTINLNNKILVTCFAIEGFKVSNVIVFNSGVIANFHIILIVTNVVFS